MNDPSSILPSSVALGLTALLSLILTLLRPPRRSDATALRRTALLAAALVGVQACHFVEETFTRFNEAFPAVFDLPPLTLELFLAFNLFWLAIWVISIFGVRRGMRTAFFPIWFLALASVLNGVAHPALALRAGGYFPGLATALLSGALGVWLCVQLWRTTAGAAARSRATRR